MTGVKDIASKNFFLRNLINFYNFHKNFKEYSESKIYKFVLKYQEKPYLIHFIHSNQRAILIKVNRKLFGDETEFTVCLKVWSTLKS